MNPNDNPADTSDLRLTELEIKITRQDDLLEELNGVIYHQQLQIDELVKKLNLLESKPVSAPGYEKPPHY